MEALFEDDDDDDVGRPQDAALVGSHQVSPAPAEIPAQIESAGQQQLESGGDVDMKTDTEEKQTEATNNDEEAVEEQAASGPVVEDAVIAFAGDELMKRVNELKKLVDDKDSVTVFPEALIEYIMKQTGCEVSDERIPKLIALEVQNYVQEILEDVKRLSSVRTKVVKPQKKQKVDKFKEDGAKKTDDESGLELLSSDLETVLRNRRVPAAQAPFHSDEHNS